jgi:hypothetical protein
MTSSGPTITAAEIGRMMRYDRPDLVEEWDEAGTTQAHLARVAANAQWLWEQNALKASLASLRSLLPGRYLRTYSIAQALWLATIADLDSENFYGPDPGDEPLTETHLRSGWFSIS